MGEIIYRSNIYISEHSAFNYKNLILTRWPNAISEVILISVAYRGWFTVYCTIQVAYYFGLTVYGLCRLSSTDLLLTYTFVHLTLSRVSAVFNVQYNEASLSVDSRPRVWITLLSSYLLQCLPAYCDLISFENHDAEHFGSYSTIFP
jgi:hypothetical protein